MTISNKYYAGFCVLTVILVVVVHIVWFIERAERDNHFDNFLDGGLIMGKLLLAECTDKSHKGLEEVFRL